MAQASVAGIEIDYYIEGQGPPLLMIMGLGGQASSWGEPLLSALRGRLTTVRFSNRGTGRSSRLDGDVTMRLMADDAAGLLDELGIERAHVLGISMGGMIAQELALNHPQRVRGLVLGCTLCGGPRAITASPEVLAMIQPEPGLPREEQIRKAWPAMCTPEFIEARREFMEEMLRESLVHPTPVQTLLRQSAGIQAFDAYGRLPGISAPTLVIHGDRDVLVPPANAVVLRERIPGAELRVIEGAAHNFFWEKPEESAAVISEFLAAVPPGA
jgi:pimeloyl-ACP methyl ester carboxylesterase